MPLVAEFPATLADEHFKVILDPISGPPATPSSKTSPHGRLAVHGSIATFAPVRISVNDLLMRGKCHPAHLANSANRALDFVTEGQVHIDITAENEPTDRRCDRSCVAGPCPAASRRMPSSAMSDESGSASEA